MRELDLGSLGFYLKYGFLDTEKTDFYDGFKSAKYLIEEKKRLISILENKAYLIVNNLDKLKKDTGYKLVLALSGGIDSLLIYILLEQSGIDFTALNIGYKGLYDESHKIKRYLGNNKNIICHNILPLGADLNSLNSIDFKFLVAHPILISYYNLFQLVPDNSIVVTGDLSDELFLPDSVSDSFFREQIVFQHDELEKLFDGDFDFSYNHIINPCDNVIENEINIYFQNITYKMIKNALGNRKIIYMPFYKEFIQYSENILQTGLYTDDKQCLYDFAKKLGINVGKEKEGFKYPISDYINDEYLSYIYKNKKYSPIPINLKYLDHIYRNDSIKKKRWKLFVLVVYLHLIKKNDIRFFQSS